VTRARVLGLVLGAAGTLGWLDAGGKAREAARLYAAGEYEAAAGRYNEALIDEPDSALLHFNLGAAEYRRGRHDAAVRAFGTLPDDSQALYNAGNALFRQGEAAAAEKPDEALARWGQALVAYRRAIAADPGDEDAKFNYEWVQRKIDELQAKREEQQNQQEQQQQQDGEQQDRQQENGQKDAQQEPEEQEGEQQDDEPPDEQARQGDEQQPQGGEPRAEDEPPAASNADAPAQPIDGRMTREQAAALLDGERGEELQPEEVVRRQLGGGGVPAQDW